MGLKRWNEMMGQERFGAVPLGALSKGDLRGEGQSSRRNITQTGWVISPGLQCGQEGAEALRKDDGATRQRKQLESRG